MKKLISLTLMLIVVLTMIALNGALSVSAVSVPYTEMEPNNSPSAADTIKNNHQVTAVLSAKDTDYFSFTVSEKSLVTYTGQSSDLNLYVGLLNSDIDVIEVEFPSPVTFKLKMTVEPGTYYAYFNRMGDVTVDINYSFLLTIEAHEHVYDDNCDAYCNTCSEYRVAPHSFANLADSQCDGCGKICSHIFSNTCDNICNRCNAVFAGVGHKYSDATCDKPKTCSVCKATSGKALGHKWAAATCTKAKTCSVCKAKSGKALGHKYTNACDNACNACGAKRTIGHKWAAATCTKAKTCSVCKAKSGKALGHSYKTTTTKATFTKAGSIVKKCTKCANVASKTVLKAVKTVKLGTTAYTYDGKAKAPAVTVKNAAGKALKKGTDYTVTYAAGCKNVGTYKVTITLKGNYSGTKTLTFTVNPKTVAGLILSAGKKQMTVSYNKDSSVGGYEIVYSTDKSFKNAKTVKVSSAKKAVKKLSSKKTYYVKVRAYKKVNGKTYYGAYCKAKTVKIK